TVGSTRARLVPVHALPPAFGGYRFSWACARPDGPTGDGGDDLRRRPPGRCPLLSSRRLCRFLGRHPALYRRPEGGMDWGLWRRTYGRHHERGLPTDYPSAVPARDPTTDVTRTVCEGEGMRNP